MKISSRKEKFTELFPTALRFRWQQIEGALFDPTFKNFGDITTLPQEVRTKLDRELKWLALEPVAVLESRKKDTYKAVIALADGKRVETVLMKNARGYYSVCVSSQVGCAMACTFCATGRMGFTRNLSTDEIIDQYRFWQYFLAEKEEVTHPPDSLRDPPAGGESLPVRSDTLDVSGRRAGYISNLVFMGMGEPLANYDNVKETLRLLLANTDMGPTRITVSTVGLLPMLEKVLHDEAWPPVRLAVSLHSADSQTRQAMMPTSYDGFLEKLVDWTSQYFKKFESRRRHLTFEYVMLSQVNDTVHHAEMLIEFARKVGKVRINLIPYNFTGSIYRDSLSADFAQFEETLRQAGVDVTKRRTMGEDIAAACGQLIVKSSQK